MRRIGTLFLVLMLLLGGCGKIEQKPVRNQYTATFLTLFDTVTTIVGFAETKDDFHVESQKIRDELEMYHHLFDIYNEYEGITNLKIVNDRAGEEPVVVDEIIIELLKDCKSYYEETGGKVNVAMGSVLKLWHDARSAGLHDPERAELPKMEKLTEASAHCSMEDVILDEEASTVYFKDPMLKLDVGAVAKGWAAQQIGRAHV